MWMCESKTAATPIKATLFKANSLSIKLFFSVDCSTVECPPVQQVVCPADSYETQVRLTADGCCTLPTRCECLPGMCGFPQCASGTVPRIIFLGDSSPGKCCDVFECVNGMHNNLDSPDSHGSGGWPEAPPADHRGSRQPDPYERKRERKAWCSHAAAPGPSPKAATSECSAPASAATIAIGLLGARHRARRLRIAVPFRGITVTSPAEGAVVCGLNFDNGSQGHSNTNTGWLSSSVVLAYFGHSLQPLAFLPDWYAEQIKEVLDEGKNVPDVKVDMRMSVINPIYLKTLKVDRTFPSVD
ncbi:UNVERIFIED_CONTAM: hypothetical protein FKN15_020426 [Acipenser sinensis]